MKLRFLGFSVLILTTCTGAFADVARLENRLVAFSFDASRGTYAVTDKRDNSVCLEDAVFAIDKYSSDQAEDYHWDKEKINDELGAGEKIVISGKVKDAPLLRLIFEVCIYEDRGCITLNQGIENQTDQNYRVMAFSPLSGSAYRGSKFVDFKTLDGENGFKANAVLATDLRKSRNNLLATFGARGSRKQSLVIGGLTTNEFQKYASVQKTADSLKVQLTADDPVGKLIDAHSKYVFNDKFYVDFSIDNRFETLEKYGLALRLANHADIKVAPIPILNFWYSHITKFGGDEDRDNSPGTITEMQQIINSGFLKYSPVGLRLEPDDYSLPSNQQGWWDDKHWQMYKSGQLREPYETIVKWGRKVHEMGGVPFIYCQTAKRSEDYCVQHPEQMLFKSATHLRSKGPVGWWGKGGDVTAGYWTYDFTNPAFIAHMKDVYANLKAGGVAGIKFDYPDTGWSYDGGFDDPHATATSAYRNIFRLAYEGLGPGRDVQERIPPFGDIALGVVTTQRTEGDNDRVYPGRVSKTGLRWYKNRMVVNYDQDPINPYHIYPKDTRDGWRSAITMTYTTSGRMEIGKYFEKMTPDMLYDLSRAVPLLPTPTVSARPVDAFSGKVYPQIYDLKVGDGWHIVTLYNYKLDGEKWPTDVMAYWYEGRQFNPKKMLPDEIEVSLGDQTDDGGLGLEAGKKYYVFDFWNWNFVGRFEGGTRLKQKLRAGEARVLSLHEAQDVPQFIATNRHILQGYLDMTQYPQWSAEKSELGGISKLIGGEAYKVVIAGNGFHVKRADARDATCEIEVLDKANSIYALNITSPKTADVSWSVGFEKDGSN